MQENNEKFDEQIFFQRKNKIFSTKVDRAVSMINFLLTYCLIDAVIFQKFFPQWMFTPIYFGYFITATLYIVSKIKKFNAKAVFSGSLALISSFTLAFHENETNLIVLLTIVFLSGVYVVSLSGSNVHSSGSYFYLTDIFRCEVVLPLRHYFDGFFAFFRRSNEKKPTKESRKRFFAVIGGIILSIPILSVIIPLLIEGDAAFESTLGSIWYKLNDGILNSFGEFDFLTVICTLFITSFVAPYIYSVMFSFANGIIQRENTDKSHKYVALRRVSELFLTVLLGIVCSVYILYLFSQTAYIFSAFTGKLPFGYETTFAQYAMRGFFEMAKIAGINFGLIAFSVLFCKRESGKLPKTIKIIDGFLCVFAILICLASISKLWLYMGEFGLTQKRIYVFLADIVMIATFLCVLIRLLSPKMPYMKIILSFICFVVGLSSVIGLDGFIATYNTNAYLSGKIENFPFETYCDYDFYAQTKNLLKIASSNDKNANKAEKMLKMSFLNYEKRDLIQSLDEKKGYELYLKYKDKYLSGKSDNSVSDETLIWSF